MWSRTWEIEGPTAPWVIGGAFLLVGLALGVLVPERMLGHPLGDPTVRAREAATIFRLLGAMLGMLGGVGACPDGLRQSVGPI